jgi:hypothetical protein
MMKKGIIRVGNVITYKRAFVTSEVIEKDIIVSFYFLLCLFVYLQGP